jgi:translation initiation factor IF-2
LISRIRIYELAKELGVDNRVVIAKAQELGMKDKTSHSHSLEDEQAEKLRRSFLGGSLLSGLDIVKSSTTLKSLTEGKNIDARNSIEEKNKGVPIKSEMQHRSSSTIASRTSLQTRPSSQKSGVQSSNTAVAGSVKPRPAGAVIVRRRAEGAPPASSSGSSSSYAAKPVVTTPTTTPNSSSVAATNFTPESKASLVEEAPVFEAVGITIQGEDSFADLFTKESPIHSPTQNIEESDALNDSQEDAESKEFDVGGAPGGVNGQAVTEFTETNPENLSKVIIEESITPQVISEPLIEKASSVADSAPVTATPSGVHVDGDDNKKSRGPKVLGRIESFKPQVNPSVATKSPAANNESALSKDQGEKSLPEGSTPGIRRPMRQEFSSSELQGARPITRRREDILRANSERQVEVVKAPEVRQPVGPRVVGKIELPGARRKVERTVEAPPGKIGGGGQRPTTGAPGSSARPAGEAPGAKDLPRTGRQQIRPAEIEDDEDEDGEKKGLKSQKRKREFSRLELIDYEGSGEVKRGNLKGKSGAKGRASPRDRGEEQREVANPTKLSKKVVRFSEVITVGDLAHQMSVKVGEVIGKLMGLGVLATINQSLDNDTATLVAEEFGFSVESTSFDEAVFMVDEDKEDPEKLSSRPPVVTVMGHVDHGKTSLLDYIRKASVAQREHGGITQHIGAYQVHLPEDKLITFVDTPGHAAFTAMRARGAEITDIVILVVAADDGVMPQTIEALNHAKAAKVPIIVAINKIDRPGANIDRIKSQLSEHGLQPEDWGGDTMYFPVSALKGDGMSELLDGILLLAEIRELKANRERRAKGVVIETRQERGRGTVATILVQGGILRVGDIFVAGTQFGRVRSMLNEHGVSLSEAPPSTPVEITGLNEPPAAGDDFFVVAEEAQARDIAMNRSEKEDREERAKASGPISLEEFSRRAATDAPQELNIILKADVHGSLEALSGSLNGLSTPKVRVKILHAGVGGVTESDVQLSLASKAIIIGFGVRGEVRAMAEAERTNTEVRFYRIIYDVIDDVKAAMVGLLEPIREEVNLGRAEVREVFVVPKIGSIGGSYVSSGIVRRGTMVRVVRDNRVIYQGKLGSLRRFKDDVREVQSGYECGIGVENFNDIKSGDILEIFEIQEKTPTL